MLFAISLTFLKKIFFLNWKGMFIERRDREEDGATHMADPQHWPQDASHSSLILPSIYVSIARCVISMCVIKNQQLS